MTGAARRLAHRHGRRGARPRPRARAASCSTCRPGRATTPGSHLDIRLTAPDGYQAQRSYSIASSGEGTRVVLAVDELPDGEVSPFLVHELRGRRPARGARAARRVLRLAAAGRRDADAGPGAAHRGRLGRRAAVRDAVGARGRRRRDRVPAAVLGAHAGRRVLPRGARLRSMAVDYVYTREIPDGWPTPAGRLTKAALEAAIFAAGARAAHLRLRSDAVRRDRRRLADRARPRHDIHPHRAIRRLPDARTSTATSSPGTLADLFAFDAHHGVRPLRRLRHRRDARHRDGLHGCDGRRRALPGMRRRAGHDRARRRAGLDQHAGCQRARGAALTPTVSTARPSPPCSRRPAASTRRARAARGRSPRSGARRPWRAAPGTRGPRHPGRR